jgi:phospholipid-binding lipoprotein MlaA
MLTGDSQVSRFPVRTLIPVVALLLSVGGCASVPTGAKPDPRDRFERANRGIYAFNVKIDHAVLRPTARAYVKITPRPVRTGVSNFLSNLTYTTTIVNDFLQGQWRHGASDTARLVVNSLFGVAGIFDVATPSGLDRNYADFGQTMGKWGVHSGPYVMLPFLGPSTVRDAIGLLPDEYTTIRAYIINPYVRWGLFSLDVVDRRVGLLDEDKILDRSYDPYAFLRNVYLQRRDYQVHGDQSPEEQFPDLDDSGDAPPPK